MTRSWMIHAAGVVTVASALSAQGTIPPAVDTVLRAAGQYLAQYEQDVSGIVAEEDYFQRIPGEMRSRRLRSDILVIRDKDAGWITFRDVYQMDGYPVRNRDDRLAQLFLQPNPDAIAQARRIVEESSRFNLNPQRGGVSRTINRPFTALAFLQARNQARSEFKIERTRESGGVREVRLTFVEKAKPRLIESPDKAAATGSFWIDPASGRVSESELLMQTGATRAAIRMKYAEQPKLKLWLPASMEEAYATQPMGIEGHATYSNFRQFKVETDTIVK